MEVREALQKRRNISKYTEDEVSKEQLDELFACSNVRAECLQQNTMGFLCGDGSGSAEEAS